MTNTRMVLLHGYDWEAKLIRTVRLAWASLPWYKRLYWRLRGEAPGTDEEIIERVTAES